MESWNRRELLRQILTASTIDTALQKSPSVKNTTLLDSHTQIPGIEECLPNKVLWMKKNTIHFNFKTSLKTADFKTEQARCFSEIGVVLLLGVVLMHRYAMAKVIQVDLVCCYRATIHFNALLCTQKRVTSLEQIFLLNTSKLTALICNQIQPWLAWACFS